jgi:hypothetical protein
LPSPEAIEDQLERDKKKKREKENGLRLPLHLPNEDIPQWPANADDHPNVLDEDPKKPTVIIIEW